MNTRLTAILLVICMLFALAGCGQEEKTIPAETVQTTEAVETTAPTEYVGFRDLDDPSPAETEKAEETEAAEQPTEAPTEAPEEPSEAPDAGGNAAPEVVHTEYEKYMNMSGAEQKAFMESFDSIEAFFAWLNQAQAEYEALHPEIEVGSGGTVDLTKGNG